MDYTSVRNVCTPKEVVRRKDQPREWKDVFANCLLDQGLMIRLYKELLKIKKKKKTSSYEMNKGIAPKKTYKWATNLRRDILHQRPRTSQ